MNILFNVFIYAIEEWELFDLQEDTHEMESVYGDPDYFEIRAGLKQELERLREQYQVPEEDPV